MNEERLFNLMLSKQDKDFIPPHEFNNAITHLSHHSIDTHLHPVHFKHYKDIVKRSIGDDPKLSDNAHKELLDKSFGKSGEGIARLLKSGNTINDIAKELEKKPQIETKTEPYELHKYGALADASYTHYRGESVEDFLKKSPIDEVAEFVVDNELSTNDNLVLHNPLTKETHISYRGTQKLSDWKTNIKAMSSLETHSPLVKGAIKTAEDVLGKYGGDNLSVSGHSLGGMRSLEVAHYLDKKGVNVAGYHYDPGVSVRQMLNQNKLGTANQTIFRTHFDSPSIVGKMAQLKTPKNLDIINVPTSPEVDMKTPILDTHSTKHFTPENIVGFTENGDVLVKRHTTSKIVANALRTGENGLNVVANNSKFLKKAVRFGGEIAEKSAMPLAVAGVSFDIYNDITDPNKSQTEKSTDIAVDSATGVASWVGGNMAGELAMGATLALCPECALLGAGVGLAVGVGAGVGISEGGRALKKTAEKSVGAVEDFGEDVVEGVEDLGKEAIEGVEDLGQGAYEGGKKVVSKVGKWLGF
jgi:hypothetical protein